MRKTLLLAAALIGARAINAQPVAKLKVTILTTMVSDLKGMGEWGFSALVETDSTRIIFDVGAHPNTMLDNAAELQVDLAGIRQVVLSHNHGDHTAGLQNLRKRFPDQKTASTVYIGQGFFIREVGGLKKATDSLAFRSSGGNFVVVDKPVKIGPGLFLTGPVPRKYPTEKNFPLGRTLTPVTAFSTAAITIPAGATVEDNVPEDMSMVIETPKGLVILMGCGHAGIINTLEYVQQQFAGKQIFAIVGGAHLIDTKDDQLDWTAGKLKAAGIRYFVGAHCTGLNSVYRIREITGLPKTDCLVAAVGNTFTLDKGITTGWLR